MFLMSDDRRLRARPEIEIRTPLGGRLAQGAVLAIGGFVALLVTIALAGRGTLWAILAGVALGVWVAYYYRLLNLSVVVRGDVLEARNLFSTHRIVRGTVGRVTLGESTVAKTPNQTVVLALDNGRCVTLDACARTLQSRRKRRRVEDFQRRLTQWSEVEQPTVTAPEPATP
jgi:membrane protein implicated in regulation of membrane protease activity